MRGPSSVRRTCRRLPWQIRLAQILAHDRASDDEADDLLQRAIGTLHSTGVYETPELIEPYMQLARIRSRKRDYGDARQYYHRAIRALDALQPEFSDRFAAALLEASEVEDRDGEPKAADVLLQRAAALARARSQQDPHTASLVIHRLASRELVRRPAAAEELYLETLALLERGGTRGAFRYRVHSDLGALYEELGDAARAGEQRELAAGLSPGDEMVPLVRVEPEYPPAALRSGAQGGVLVSLMVSVDGRVTKAHVLESDPPRVFDEAALAAVRQWTFDPKVVSEKPPQWRYFVVLLRFEPPR